MRLLKAAALAALVVAANAHNEPQTPHMTGGSRPNAVSAKTYGKPTVVRAKSGNRKRSRSKGKSNGKSHSQSRGRSGSRPRPPQATPCPEVRKEQDMHQVHHGKKTSEAARGRKLADQRRPSKPRKSRSRSAESRSRSRSRSGSRSRKLMGQQMPDKSESHSESRGRTQSKSNGRSLSKSQGRSKSRDSKGGKSHSQSRSRSEGRKEVPPMHKDMHKGKGEYIPKVHKESDHVKPLIHGKQEGKQQHNVHDMKPAAKSQAKAKPSSGMAHGGRHLMGEEITVHTKSGEKRSKSRGRQESRSRSRSRSRSKSGSRSPPHKPCPKCKAKAKVALRGAGKI